MSSRSSRLQHGEAHHGPDEGAAKRRFFDASVFLPAGVGRRQVGHDGQGGQPRQSRPHALHHLSKIQTSHSGYEPKDHVRECVAHQAHEDERPPAETVQPMSDERLGDHDDQRIDREEPTDRERAGPHLPGDERQAEQEHTEGKGGEQHTEPQTPQMPVAGRDLLVVRRSGCPRCGHLRRSLGIGVAPSSLAISARCSKLLSHSIFSYLAAQR